MEQCVSTTRRGLLKTTAGAGMTATTATVLTGGAAAHFPATLEIDVQPHNADNYIDTSKHDSVSVAIFETEFLDGDGKRVTFDPEHRPIRYRFGAQSAVTAGEGARPTDDELTTIDTGHGDPRQALVLEFPVSELQLDGTEETLWLYWDRDYTSQHGLRGFDAVSVYGGGQSTGQPGMSLSAEQLLARLRQLLFRRSPR